MDIIRAVTKVKLPVFVAGQFQSQNFKKEIFIKGINIADNINTRLLKIK